ANKFPQLAALDGAIDKNPKAYEWLKTHKMDFLLVFADACNERQPALVWLAENNLEIFLHLAQKIKKFRDNKTFDYHKKPF
ncbi:MAG: hypothetical protein DRJ15_12380, partial [Bacteroidetes bacterium]